MCAGGKQVRRLSLVTAFELQSPGPVFFHRAADGEFLACRHTTSIGAVNPYGLHAFHADPGVSFFKVVVEQGIALADKGMGL